MNKIQTRTATISRDENGVILIVIHKGVCIDFPDALDNALVVRNLSKNERCLKLIDVRNTYSIDNRARDLIASKEVQEKTIARAILVRTFIKKILLNFYLELNIPRVPAKTFTKYDEAYNWLLIQGIKKRDFEK